MKKEITSRLVILLAVICAMAAVVGCGGGGGGESGAPAGTSPSITTASLPGGVRGQLYTVALGAAGGTAPYTWSQSGLPPGISLGGETGILSGTPTADDAFAPIFTVTDAAGHSATVQLSLLIDPPPPPAVATASLAAGTRTQPYAGQLAASGGTPPYTWTVSTGPGADRLPAGVTLGADGSLSGVPAEEGTFNPVFTVRDNNALAGSRQIALAIGAPPSPSVATPSLPTGVRAQGYAAQLAATSGTPPYSWSVSSGTLPPGLILDPATGALSGTPTDNGVFAATFTVTDFNGLTGARQLSIVVNPSESPVVATSALPGGARTEPYAAALAATGGTPPYAWSAAGLPPGLALSADGTLSGTPTAEGTFAPVFTVTDALSMQAARSLGLRIAAPVALYVADAATPSGAIAAIDDASVADGNAAWTRRLAGALTTLDNAVGGPPAGVSCDAARNILYVARARGSDNGAVLVYAGAAARDGNAAPNRIIRTFTIPPNAFALTSPSDVFVDSGNDRLYVADVTGTSGFVLILDGASTAPSFRKIIGFPYGPPAAIAVDVARDILYVVPSQGTGFVAFDNASGATGARRTITIGAVSGAGLADVKVDTATDTAYVADYDGGRVFAISNVSQKNGTYAPDRTLTGLSNPNSVFPDVHNDRLFVSSRDGASSYSVGVVEGMATANGAVSFSRRISGFGVAAGMSGVAE